MIVVVCVINVIKEKGYEMECTICKSSHEVDNLAIYTIGSEGTNLCLECRIIVSNMLKGMMSRCSSIELKVWKEVNKKGGGVK